jgi:hypothetical protein
MSNPPKLFDADNLRMEASFIVLKLMVEMIPDDRIFTQPGQR